jgi:hypothetical protein
MGLGTSYNNIINYNLQHSTIHCKNEYNNTIYTELREQVLVTYNSPQLEQIIAYTIFLVLHDISCISVKVRPFLNVNEVPSIKLGHVIHLTIIRANEHVHHCSGGHFKIFPLYKVNTEGDILRRRKETLLIVKRLINFFKVFY